MLHKKISQTIKQFLLNSYRQDTFHISRCKFLLHRQWCTLLGWLSQLIRFKKYAIWHRLVVIVSVIATLLLRIFDFLFYSKNSYNILLELLRMEWTFFDYSALPQRKLKQCFRHLGNKSNHCYNNAFKLVLTRTCTLITNQQINF